MGNHRPLSSLGGSLWRHRLEFFRLPRVEPRAFHQFKRHSKQIHPPERKRPERPSPAAAVSAVRLDEDELSQRRKDAENAGNVMKFLPRTTRTLTNNRKCQIKSSWLTFFFLCVLCELCVSARKFRVILSDAPLCG